MLKHEAWPHKMLNKYKRIVLLLSRQMQIDASHGENRSGGVGGNGISLL